MLCLIAFELYSRLGAPAYKTPAIAVEQANWNVYSKQKNCYLWRLIPKGLKRSKEIRRMS